MATFGWNKGTVPKWKRVCEKCTYLFTVEICKDEKYHYADIYEDCSGDFMTPGGKPGVMIVLGNEDGAYITTGIDNIVVGYLNERGRL